MHRVTHHGAASASAAARDDGASLIMVLVIMTVLFTIMVALFGYAVLSVRSLETYRIDRTLRVTADAALEVGIQMVKEDPELGETVDPEPCSTEVPFDEPTGPGYRPSMAPGSYLVVTCEATPGAPSGGVTSGDGQQARDVTFTVVCHAESPRDRDELYSCSDPGPGTVAREVGSARVRFEVDPGHVPADGRAIVPKVVAWSVLP